MLILRPLSSRSLLSRHRSFSTTLVQKMKVIPVEFREDNYGYLLIDEATNKAGAVDPYNVPKLKAAAESAGVEIIAAITTHHHFDHAGGNKDFAKEYPNAPIYGGSKQVDAVTHIVKDKDTFNIGDTILVKCLATPCHTQDSICYHATSSDATNPATGGVFTGDTLFIAGCGRFFEDKTIVYNGHEYTAGNLAFAKSVDGDNPALTRLEKIVNDNKITTGLTTIGDEKEWNPFIRLDDEGIRAATGKTTNIEVIDELRRMKNHFRG
ncbi:metallo-beta-lactamase superfamily protein [Abortiporus biennis]